MDEKTLVSVIIPTYKRSNMLPRAINSVLNQTYEVVQVVVIDDNEPLSKYRTQTQEIMAQYDSNKKVKYICHESNRNGAAARNTGIKYSDGEMVTFLDDDDFYQPDKIKKQVDFLNNNRQYRAVYCGWDREGKINIPFHRGDLSYDILSGDHIIYSNTIMMYRNEAMACGGWDETFRRHQEAAFLLRYFRIGGVIGVVEEALVVFDVSDRSNAAANAKMNEEQTLYYLESYKDMILNCGKAEKNADKKIYTHRYRGIFINYIKTGDIKGALSFWRRKCMEYPLRMICVMIRYTLSYLKRR